MIHIIYFFFKSYFVLLLVVVFWDKSLCTPGWAETHNCPAPNFLSIRILSVPCQTWPVSLLWIMPSALIYSQWKMQFRFLFTCKQWAILYIKKKKKSILSKCLPQDSSVRPPLESRNSISFHNTQQVRVLSLVFFRRGLIFTQGF